MSNKDMKVGQKVRITKRRTGERKGNAYPILAIAGGKAKLGHPEKPDRFYDLRDLS